MDLQSIPFNLSGIDPLSFFLSCILKIDYIRGFVFFPELVFQTAKIILMV